MLHALASGDSCALVGVGSSGKSNVVRHLLRVEVREHHIGAIARASLVALADFQRINSDYSARSVGAVVLSGLVKSLRDHGGHLANQAELIDRLGRLWDANTDAASPERMWRALDEAVRALFERGVQHVFIVLDDFDHVIANAPPDAVNSLRALRDDYKARLAYITVTRRELQHLQRDGRYEDFIELATAKSLAIGPYRTDDALAMLNTLLTEWKFGPPVSEPEKQRVIDLSGGHAGLIRAVMQTKRDDPALDLSRPIAIEVWRENKYVIPVHALIFDSLSAGELADLNAIARGAAPARSLRTLEKKGLVRASVGAPGQLVIFSPLFADAVVQRADVGASPKQDKAHHTVRVGDAVLTLDEIEYRLLAYLKNRRGQAVPRTELFRQVSDLLATPEQRRRLGGSPDDRFDHYIEQLRKKVGPDRLIASPDGTYRLI